MNNPRPGYIVKNREDLINFSKLCLSLGYKIGYKTDIKDILNSYSSITHWFLMRDKYFDGNCSPEREKNNPEIKNYDTLGAFIQALIEYKENPVLQLPSGPTATIKHGLVYLNSNTLSRDDISELHEYFTKE